MTGIVCQILAARRAPCQIVNVRLEFDTCVKFSARPGPSDVKVSDAPGPPCVKFSKKRSSLVSKSVGGCVKFRCALRPVSKFRPRRGPCVESVGAAVKVSAQAGPTCQSVKFSTVWGPSCVKVSAPCGPLCQSVKVSTVWGPLCVKVSAPCAPPPLANFQQMGKINKS